MKRFIAAVFAAMLAVAGVSVAISDPAHAVTIDNCMPQLSTCGYPTFATVGADPLTSFTPYSGVLTTSSNNQVIEDLDITGCIVIQNTGVVINNVMIHGDCFYGIDYDSGSFTVTNSSIACDNGENTGIDAANATVTAVFVERCENAIVTSGDVTVEDSILMAFEAQPGVSHGDLIQVFAGNNVTIDHNVLAGYNPMTSAIIGDLSSDVDNFTITDNFLMGGSYELYCALSTSGWTVTGNRFYPLAESPGADRRSPAYGLTVNCDGDVDISWSGNYSDFDGSTVNSDGTLS